MVIVNWNTRALLKQCLLSLERALGTRRAQVVVVDNSSSDGSSEMVKSLFPWVEAIASESNLGFAAANNLALNRTTGGYILFLNPDTEVTLGAIDTMVQLLDRYPDVGIVGTTLLNPDGSLQLSCHRFYGLLHSLKNNRVVDQLLGRREMLALHRAQGPVDVDWMTGACLAVRKNALDAIGAFDTDFFLYGEEIDLQYRMHQKGWRVTYVRSSGVIHHGGQSARQSPAVASLHDYRGRWLFLRKHYSLPSRIGYLIKCVGALIFWMLYWGTVAVIRPGCNAQRQWREYGKLLRWHLIDRETAPTPTRPATIPVMSCDSSGSIRLDLQRRSVPMEEIKR